ncbi:MAG: NUDIX domain-containing protein [Vicingaceae bacterium]
MYKVFINHKTIFLTDSFKKVKNFDDSLYTKYCCNEEILELVNLIKIDIKLKQIVLFGKDVDFLLEQFKKTLKVIEAAGGIVKNKQDEILCIYRNGFWDFPKGKLEQGEDISTTAVREIKEECGVNNIKIIEELNTTYHIYFENNVPVLKVTYWFLMDATFFEGPLIPQKEEGIEKAEWLNKKQMMAVFYPKTYESLKDLFDKSLSMLYD